MSESLATKYRPKTFTDVVGQDKIKTILQSQLRNNDFKRGYLFTGSAGTGKTTCARIFARQINTVYQDSAITATYGEIIEIDAASNNGVDNVRELRENCKFKPINGGYKVYVIDEVHMLSTGAFNALLKTLEEPPEHCVFILCTTDPQKIPPTILSRVQRFDFRRISHDLVIHRLLTICEQQGINNVDKDALEYIARMANGGMRDAISLLETCSNYSDGSISLQDVEEILGGVKYDEYMGLYKEVINRHIELILDRINRLYFEGKDLKVFIKGFLEFIVEAEKTILMKGVDFTQLPTIYSNHILLDKDYRIEKLEKLYQAILSINNLIKYESNPKIFIEGELICLHL